MSQQGAGGPDGHAEAEGINPAGPAAEAAPDMLAPWELGYDEDDEVDDDEADEYLDEDEEVDMEDWIDDEVPDLDDVDSEDEDWMSEEEEDYLSTKQRVHLECGVLQHDANFFVDDSPAHHSAVHSSTCHHQTADAITFLPRPDTATVAASGTSTVPAVTAASVDVEEVLVSDRQKLSIYQLAAGKPARLLARNSTCFRHYSIAASPCGNFVAASGNQGLVVLFRVQRSSCTDPPQRSTTSSNPSTSAAASASNSSSSKAVTHTAGQASSSSVALPWQLVHEATLLCAVGRESMVNSVRFGQFGGTQRLLVSHQDGMLYLFNLPTTEVTTDKTAATSQAAAAGSPSSSVTGSPAAGAGLMVKGLPDWEPQGSQINCRYVEQLMAIANQHMQQAAQQQPDLYMDVDTEQQQTDGASGSSSAFSPAAGQKRQKQQQQRAAELAKQRRIDVDSIKAALKTIHEARLARVSAGLTELELNASNASGTHDTSNTQTANVSQPAPGSLEHLKYWMGRSCSLLLFLVRNLSTTGNVLQSQLDGMKESLLSSNAEEFVQCPDVREWHERCRMLEQLLQDDQCLQDVQRLQQMRYIFGDERMDFRYYGVVREYSRLIARLREAAAAQEDMVGLKGQQRQQQQWQQQQQAGDADMHVAVIWGVYYLLLLRLLVPSGLPTMKQNARVLVIKHGPTVDPSARLQSSDMRAAPRMYTCAISNIAPDTGAQQQAATAAREAQRLEAEALQPGASAETVAAAAIAAQDAQRAAAEQQILPLNICESSPDGCWLAVGVDQAGIVLVPAGPGYQHQSSHVLDLCPLLHPFSSHWRQTGTLGCQYLAFNSSSTLLAATSDHLRLVSVFEVASGQLLATFSLHNRPVLPVRFMSNFIRRDFNKTGNSSSSGSSSQTQQMDTQGTAAVAASQQQQGEGDADGSAAVVHELWGDRVLVYCESRGGLHIADMSVFLNNKHQAALPPLAAAYQPASHADDRECSTVSAKFCLKTYLEVPPEPATVTAAAKEPSAQQQQQQHQDEAEAMLDAALHGEAAPSPGTTGDDDDDDDDDVDDPIAQKINGLVVTPAGRVLVAAQHELLEWQLLTGWSVEHHKRFPPAFKSAVQLLLTAAHHPNSNTDNASSSTTASAATGSNPSGAMLLSRLPDDVLKRILADAALPQGAWASMKVPTQQQLLSVLHNRPKLPESDFPAQMAWPWNMLGAAGQGFNPAQPQGGFPAGQGAAGGAGQQGGGVGADQLQFQAPAAAAGGVGGGGGQQQVGALQMLAQLQAAVGQGWLPAHLVPGALQGLQQQPLMDEPGADEEDLIG